MKEGGRAIWQTRAGRDCRDRRVLLAQLGRSRKLMQPSAGSDRRGLGATSIRTMVGHGRVEGQNILGNGFWGRWSDDQVPPELSRTILIFVKSSRLAPRGCPLFMRARRKIIETDLYRSSSDKKRDLDCAPFQTM